MIETRNLSLIRQGRRLLDRVSLRMEPGRLHVILGPNGAGKSTLLRVLTGSLEADEGSVHLDGRPIRAYASEDLARRRGVLSQDTALAFDFRVEEVVMLGRIPHLSGWETAADAEACQRAMKQVDLLPFADRSYHSLSGGEKQRVQLARVLAQLDLQGALPEEQATRWLFLDEPTSALDLRHQHAVLDLVKQLLPGPTGPGVVMVLHDLNLALQYADQVVLLKEGTVAAEGEPAATLTPARVGEVYGVQAEALCSAQTHRPLIHVLQATHD